MITIFSNSSFVSTLSSNIDILAGMLDNYLTGAGNLRMASIILMLLAFILFLFLIIILYVKSLTSFLKSEQSDAQKNEKTSQSFFETMDNDAEEAQKVKIREEELEKELERDLEKALAEKAAREEREAKEKKTAELEQAKREEDLLAEPKVSLPKKLLARNDNVLDFDWKKGKTSELENNAQSMDIPVLQYQQTQKKLSELLGLIIDMLGRNVDDLKIAQTVTFRNMNQNSEEDILQTIDAVKDFIALCINGKFSPLRTTKQLPDESKALFNLANGDSSPALSLMEALMDDNIDRAAVMPQSSKRDEIFAITSNYATTFGTLAAISDVHLATGAFELAIELFPQNVNAWNRIGDMYIQTKDRPKAVKAYQNVLNMSDEEINQRQIANAQKMMSEYYYEQGDSLKAAKLYNSSKGYYDSLGINRRLDRQEVEIVEIIENHQQEELESTINKILSNQNLRQYSYA